MIVVSFGFEYEETLLLSFSIVADSLFSGNTAHNTNTTVDDDNNINKIILFKPLSAKSMHVRPISKLCMLLFCSKELDKLNHVFIKMRRVVLVQLMYIWFFHNQYLCKYLNYSLNIQIMNGGIPKRTIATFFQIESGTDIYGKNAE